MHQLNNKLNYSHYSNKCLVTLLAQFTSIIRSYFHCNHTFLSCSGCLYLTDRMCGRYRDKTFRRQTFGRHFLAIDLWPCLIPNVPIKEIYRSNVCRLLAVYFISKFLLKRPVSNIVHRLHGCRP